MNGPELINVARQLAEDKQTPTKVSNRMLWALAVDALHDRRRIDTRLRKLETAAIRRSALWGGLAGLVSAAVAIVAVLRLFQ